MKDHVNLLVEAQEIHDTWLTKNGGFAKDMTMRDHYAGQALHGILTRKVFTTAERISEVAYEIADAMLVAREAK
jgi:hypothetical protein